MSDFQTEMNRVVQGFVAQITDLARRAAIDTLESALRGGSSSGGGRSARGGGGSSSFSSAGRGRGKGIKRTSDELDGLSDQFVDYVKSNPGLRIEQINKALGTTTKDLQLPIRKLIAEGVLKVKGQKRSTQYFPGTERKRSKK